MRTSSSGWTISRRGHRQPSPAECVVRVVRLRAFGAQTREIRASAADCAWLAVPFDPIACLGECLHYSCGGINVYGDNSGFIKLGDNRTLDDFVDGHGWDFSRLAFIALSSRRMFSPNSS